MKKRVLISLLGLTAAVAFTSCGNNDDSSQAASSAAQSSQESRQAKENEYTALIYDIDGELLNTYYIEENTDKTVLDQLKEVADVKSYQTQYGESISSIDGSIVDSNYYLALYVNDAYAEVGVSSLKASAGDTVKLSVECWNTVESGYGVLDETDVLVDKAIYQYAKKYMYDEIKNDENPFDIFWTYIAADLYDETGNGKNLSTINSTAYNTLLNYDLTTLDGTDFGKYYYTASAYGIDLAQFESKYIEYINTLSSVYSSEYVIPFIISPAKALGINDYHISNLYNTSYVPSLESEWEGVKYSNIDGSNWFYISNALFGKSISSSYLNTISQYEYNNPTSIAISIATFASVNENVRNDSYANSEGLDLLEQLLKSYDEELGLIKYQETDTGTTYSTNQIYASLIAYKLSRDNSIAYNIFS